MANGRGKAWRGVAWRVQVGYGEAMPTGADGRGWVWIGMVWRGKAINPKKPLEKKSML